MRTYAPRDTASVLDAILAEPSMARGVVHHALLPAREAAFGEFPEWLDPRIVEGLAQRAIERPYVHQAAAMELARAGRDFVVVTPTASGKTLCYALPILQAIADDPAARSLLLFPTKAL
ncbi:MAG TPA: DEAD/DEAH box helicase, partial [Candidatus Limnocylindrales bacterium]